MELWKLPSKYPSIIFSTFRNWPVIPTHFKPCLDSTTWVRKQAKMLPLLVRLFTEGINNWSDNTSCFSAPTITPSRLEKECPGCFYQEWSLPSEGIWGSSRRERKTRLENETDVQDTEELWVLGKQKQEDEEEKRGTTGWPGRRQTEIKYQWWRREKPWQGIFRR